VTSNRVTHSPFKLSAARSDRYFLLRKDERPDITAL